MDADAEPHLLAGRTTLVFFFNGVLDRDGAFDGIDRASKSATKLSPAVLKIRPRWAAINRSRIVR